MSTSPPPTPAARAPSPRSERGLDLFNFFLADVQTGVGPFLAVYLSSLGWDQQRVGMALTAAGISDIVVQTPAGALVDRVRHRRELVALAVLAITIAALMIVTRPTTGWVIAANVLLGSTASLIGPGIAAISLGLVGYGALARRQGRNRSWNSAGNLSAGLVMGLAGWWLSPGSVFWIVAVLTIPTFASLMLIRPAEIDEDLARGGAPARSRGGFRHLLGDRALLVFAGFGFLFNFANAAMLPLLGESLATLAPSLSSLAMGACMVVTQLVIAVISPAAARWVERIGRRPLLIAACVLLVARAMLFAFVTQPIVLIAGQILDGVGAGLLGVTATLVIADRTRGTAHFNITQGVIATVGGFGAALAQTVVGVIASRHGYQVAFLVLAGTAALATVTVWVGLPETRRGE